MISFVDNLNWWQYVFPLALTITFFLFLCQIIANQPQIFMKKHGRKHAMTGLLYLLWITLGFIDLLQPQFQCIPFGYFVYDFVLGILGTVLTILAAIEFQHKNVKNVASGTLDAHATVTNNEMMEHSFYQALNLIQIVYLHLFDFGWNFSRSVRIILLFLVTLPWAARSLFPTNKFSDNYHKIDRQSTPLIRLLYRIKKYQYIFYKHFILHGLNITVALKNTQLPNTKFFRLFWLLLNTSYVMEFFLQTLVKKNYMSQFMMLCMQKVLMSAATISAISVLQVVNIYIAVVSLVLNFVNRKHDVLNTMALAIIFKLVEEYL
jgi:hypothetical protein